MMEKSREIAEPSSWKFKNSTPTAVDTPWDQSRPSAYERQL